MAINERALADFSHDVSVEALHIVGDRVLEDARLFAPRLAGRMAGKGSFPRVPRGWLAAHLEAHYEEHPAVGGPYALIGGFSPAARALILYRGGAGTRGAYGGSREREPFLIKALDAQIGRAVP